MVAVMVSTAASGWWAAIGLSVVIGAIGVLPWIGQRQPRRR
jgi:energy-converting hydrogenase Eha subunit A